MTQKQVSASSTDSEPLESATEKTVEATMRRWTGEQRLLAWAQAIGIVLTPILVAYLSNSLTSQQTEISKKEQQNQIMSSYLDEMTQLLIQHKLKEKNSNSPEVTLARSITLNTARRLADPELKGQLIKFLYEAGLVDTCPNKTTAPFTNFSASSNCNESSIIDLKEAKLEDAQFDYRPVMFQGIDLERVNLSDAELKEVDLSHAVVNKAVLNGVKLNNALLNGAQMQDVEMQHATLTDATLINTKLQNARLAGSSFDNAVLFGANFRCAQLQGAKLANAKTNAATDFEGAEYDAKTTFPPTVNPDDFSMRKIDLGENSNDLCSNGVRIPESSQLTSSTQRPSAWLRQIWQRLR